VLSVDWRSLTSGEGLVLGVAVHANAIDTLSSSGNPLLMGPRHTPLSNQLGFGGAKCGICAGRELGDRH